MSVIFKKRYLILFSIFLSGISLSQKIQAQTKNWRSAENLEKSILYENRNLYANNSYEIKTSIKENFLENLKEDSFEKLIANKSNKNTLSENFLVDVEANVQSQTKDLFNAEGNVILYFSNATLKTDKLIYNRNSKEVTAEGNIFFSKGEQYFEASKLSYNLKSKKGFIKNVYGVMDFANFEKDFELKSSKINASNNDLEKNTIRNLNYINSSKFGLTTNFSETRDTSIKDLDVELPSLNKWRFKTDRLNFDNEFLISDRVFFTNDPFNKPQFLILSKNFKGELIKDKTKFVSKNTWLNFDDKIKTPIGRWTVSDRERILNWAIGSDNEEKDGFYLARDFDPLNLPSDFSLSIKPYFLFQRAIQDHTDSFRGKNTSLFSNKVENNISFSDWFAMDANLLGKINLWDIELETRTNTLNIDRSAEAIRSKLTFSRSIDLNSAYEDSRDLKKLGDIKFNNFVDLEVYSAFREKIQKGYAGEAEIYFGNGLSISNRKSWIKNNKETGLIFLYDLGQFKAKSKTANKFINTSRNLFSASIDNKITLWEKNSVLKEMDKSYKFTPQIIKPSLVWNTAVNSGLFLYGDGTSQEGITFSAGPDFIWGNLKKYFFDFSKLSTRYTYVVKSGESPFAFDDINSDERLFFEFQQQVFGPLIFSFQSYIPLQEGHRDHGDFTQSKYKLEIKRRAYSFAVVYDQDEKDLGYQLNIFNFDFSGKGNKF